MVQNVIAMRIVDWIGTGVSGGDCLLVEFSLVEITRCQHRNRYSCDLHIMHKKPEASTSRKVLCHIVNYALMMGVPHRRYSFPTPAFVPYAKKARQLRTQKIRGPFIDELFVCAVC